eukprot:m.24257 g.24257  ORF g.24257 m.24257 type:complete len:52 (+) comp9539_c1_seq2:1117-1272(+)
MENAFLGVFMFNCFLQVNPVRVVLYKLPDAVAPSSKGKDAERNTRQKTDDS